MYPSLDQAILLQTISDHVGLQMKQDEAHTGDSLPNVDRLHAVPIL